MVQVSPLKMPIRNFFGLYLLPGPKVFESDVKGSTASSSSTQNVARLFIYTDELTYSLFANQSSGPRLDHEDLKQVDEFDLEEMDLKCNSGSDTKVTSCSKECVESYVKLKKLYDEQREQLGNASIEIQAYTQALKKIEAPLKGKATGQGENRPVWNNVLRLNHQNKFVPKAVLTKTGILPVNTARQNLSSQAATTSTVDPQKALKNKGIVDSGCSRHMTGNKAYLVEYQDYNGGPVAFGGSKGQITGKGKIITRKLDFEDVYFVKELKKFNLFSVSQMCDKKNKVLFTDSECLVLSPDFKLLDENQVLLRVPRQNNMYSFNLENIVPTGGLACLIAKATVDESNKWHRRLGTLLNFVAQKGSRGNTVMPELHNKMELLRRKDKSYLRLLEQLTKPQNKTPYELITGKIPIISYIRPFGCHVTILNTIDHLGKFEEKFDEGFLVGYSLNRKAFRVYNLETKRVDENMHINFLENKPNVAEKGPNWLFDLDYLTDSMNYQPVTAENKANKTAGPKEANHSAVKSSEAKNGDEKTNGDTGPKTNEEPKDIDDQAFLEELERLKRQEKEANDAAEAFRKEFAQCTEDLLLQARAARATSTNTINTVSTPISTVNTSRVFSAGGPDLTNNDQDDSQIPALEDIYDNPSDGIFTNAFYDDKGAEAGFTNLETTVNVSHIPTSRIHSIHPTTQILRDPTSAVQTRSKVNKSSGAYAFVSYIQKQRRNNHKDFQHCLFACFLSQIEPKKISQSLEDES
ncbi:putative ribonuclease H-like domain-containing protein [Tanacetum coccineum]